MTGLSGKTRIQILPPRLTERELYDRLFKLRFQLATNQIENPGQIGLVRKELARVKTIINEKRRLTPTAGVGTAASQS